MYVPVVYCALFASWVRRGISLSVSCLTVSGSETEAKMLFRKTPTNERGNYVYRFNDGTVSVIAEGNEAEVWIKSLHSLDDAEVYNNIKNSRPQL